MHTMRRDNAFQVSRLHSKSVETQIYIIKILLHSCRRKFLQCISGFKIALPPFLFYYPSRKSLSGDKYRAGPKQRLGTRIVTVPEFG